MPANQKTRIETDIEPIDLNVNSEGYTALVEASDNFIKTQGDEVEIWAASRDWFLEEWGRDTFISLPGLLISTGRPEEAKQVFRRFARFEKNGLIPNIIRGDEISYNTADAALWFISSLEAFTRATNDWTFGRELRETVRNIISGYMSGASYEYHGAQQSIRMDHSDGLIVSPPQATWMDADPSGNGSAPVTPRGGKCVEINALWYKSLRFAMELENKAGNQATEELAIIAALVKQNYEDKFWNQGANCLLDVVASEENDSSIRCNQIFAISHGGDLLAKDKQEQVFKVVTDELLTPVGLRTLSPSHPDYKGSYDTSAPIAEKDLAYHQGTAWPWLMGAYCDALAIVREHQGASRDEIKNLSSPLVNFCLQSEYKSLPEVFSGDPPHDPGGTTSQAWSVAEVLRVVNEYCK